MWTGNHPLNLWEFMSVNLRPANDPSRAAPKVPRSTPEPSKGSPQKPQSPTEPSKGGPKGPHSAAEPHRGGKHGEGVGPKGWKSMHHINQLRPEGADKDYANGAYNCAPAVVAMLARGHGKMDDLNDAQLVQQLGQGIVTREGTTPEGVAQMMARADVPLAGDALGAGYTEKDVQDHLSQGHKLIAQVRSSNPQGEADSAHYVVVEGMTRDGNYVISDPLADKPYLVTPEQLKEAVLKAPPDGGMLIPVASPEEAQAAAAPAAPTAPTPPAAPARTADAFVDRSPREEAARRVTDPFGIRVGNFLGGANGAAQPPAGQPANAGTGTPGAPGSNAGAGQAEGAYEIPDMSFSGPRSATPPEPAAEPPAALIVDPSLEKTLQPVADDKAFTVSEEALKGVDMEFVEVEDKPLDERLAENEERNDFELEVDYQGSRENTEDLKKAVTSGKMSVAQFVEHLRELKEQGDPEAYELLSKLESSKHSKDKQVLKEIEKLDKNDPGTGSRIMGDAF